MSLPDSDIHQQLIESRRADIADHLDGLFPPEATGKVIAAFGIKPYWKQDGGYHHRQWKERAFDYPAERDTLIEWIDTAVQKGADAYLCTGMSHNGTREEGSLQGIWNLHVDWDGDPKDEDDCLFAVEKLDGYAFSTGTPGHLDCYVPLADPIITSARYDEMCKAFHAQLPPGSEKFKWNDVLRIVGTDSLKDTVRPGGTGQPTRLHWQMRPAGYRWDVDELAARLGVHRPGVHNGAQKPPQATNGTTPTIGTTQGVPFALEDYPNVAAALNNPKLKSDGTVDRSETIWATVLACAASNLTQAQAQWAVTQRQDLADKLAAGSRDDVLHCWLKAIDSRQEARRTRGGGNGAAGFFGPNLDDGGGSANAADSEASEPTTWEAFDLTPWLNGQIASPQPTIGITRADGQKVIYPGSEHTIYGETEAGKSWFALECAAVEIRAGRDVLYIHYEEGDPGSTIERLQLLAVTPHDIAKHLRFVAPSKPASKHPEWLAAQLDPPPALVIHDGVNEAMSLHGDDTNQADGASTFRRVLIKPCLRVGAATLSCDHVTKSPDGRGRYAIGSGHKVNAIDGAAFLVENITPFGRGLRGASSVYVTKDRPGQLRAHGKATDTPGKTFFGVLTVDSSPEAGADFLTFYAPRDDDGDDTSGSAGGDAMLAEHVYEIIAAMPDHRVASMRKLFAALREAEVQVRDSDVRDAVDDLEVTGRLIEVKGIRGAVGYQAVVTASQKESSDDDSDPAACDRVR